MSKLGQYEYTICRGHPRANDDGSVYSHILIAEEKIGRYLFPDEVVHHIDEDKANNSPDNLVVFATKGDHTSFHRKGFKLQDLPQNEYGSYYVPFIMRQKFCKNCGIKIDKGATYCRPCYDIIQRTVANRPSRTELKTKIRQASFTNIGKEYGVSDNTIRKWCKRYQLPYRAQDIKLISDEDWELL